MKFKCINLQVGYWHSVLLLLFSHSVVCNCLRPHGLKHAWLLSFTICWSLLILMSIELVMSYNHLILCHPLLLLPSIFPSISPYSKYSALISFSIDWFDLLAVQRTLKSLLQYHSLKPSILLCSTFFMVQLSHPYMTTGKPIALTI